MERRLAAILVTDVVGYSGLMARDEAGTLAALKAMQADLIDPKIAEHKGRVVKLMGDGMLVEFGSVVEGVRCAVAIQTEIADQADAGKPGARLDYRMGINLGDVIVDGDDIHGDGVNVAARLQTLAQPGAVVLSDDAYRQIRDRLDIVCHDLGEQEVKNIPRPVRIWEWRSNRPVPARLVNADLPLPDRPSIVVLPFRNLTGDSAQDYLAEGLRIDIQNALVKVSGLFVIAFGSANAFRGNSVEAATRHLGVRCALECSVRRAGNHVRIAAALTDCASGRIVWAEHFDRILDDTFESLDEITGRILTAMNVKLVAGEPAKVWHKTLKDLKSLEAFYRGLSEFFKMNREAMSDARRQFEFVAGMHPEAAIGATWVALTHWYDLQRGWTESPERSRELARQSAERAAAMDDADGQAHAVLSHVHLLNREFDAALTAGREAVANRPNCTFANGFFGNVLHYCGQQQAAIHHVNLAIRYSPMHPPLFKEILATAYRAAGDLDSAVATAKEAIALNPTDLVARLVLASAYVRSNDGESAARMAEEIRQLDPSFSLDRFAEGQPYRDNAFLEQFVADLEAASIAH